MDAQPDPEKIVASEDIESDAGPSFFRIRHNVSHRIVMLQAQAIVRCTAPVTLRLRGSPEARTSLPLRWQINTKPDRSPMQQEVIPSTTTGSSPLTTAGQKMRSKPVVVPTLF
jgi:hypothetical protein